MPSSPTNLYQYYTSQGQALPSIQARQGIATQAGITGYTGTAAQNNQLLGYLQTKNTAPTTNVVAPATPQTPPSIISSETYAKKNTDNINKLNTVSQKGMYMDENGSLRLPNGKMALQTTAEVTLDDNTQKYFNNLYNQLDSQTAQNLAGIHERFNQYRKEQQDITGSQSNSMRNALLQGSTMGGTGSSYQYAPGAAEATINGIAQQGLKAIRALDDQENQYIMAAQRANEEGKANILNQILQQTEKIRSQKLAETQKLNDTLLGFYQKQEEERLIADTENSIADIYSSGTTNPAEIMKKLREQGYNVTSKQVKDTVDNIAGGFGLTADKLNSDVDEYNYFKNKKGGLPISITSLGSEQEQLMEYIRQKNSAKSEGTASGKAPFTKQKGSSGGSAGGSATVSTSSGGYTTDLDSIIGATLSIIPTKFGQQTFKTELSKARDDSDKIKLVAAQVLKNSPSEVKNDFINQSSGIKQIDKAIKLLDEGTKTGVFNNAKQYTYNLAGKDYDPKLAAVQSYITAAIQPYRASVTGAAWGEQEEAEYRALFGNTKYSPTELKQRLTRVKEIMKDKSVAALSAQVDPFSSSTEVFTDKSAYTIYPGDTYKSIAKKLGVTVEQLRTLNPNKNEKNLKVGESLVLPSYVGQSASPLGGSSAVDFIKNPIPTGTSGGYSSNFWNNAQ